MSRWSLRLRVFLFFALIAVAGALAICGGLALGYSRVGDASVIAGFVTAGLVAAFVLAGVVAWVWLLFDENVVKPVNALAGDLRSRAHAGVEGKIDRQPGRYLGDLPAAAAEAAAQLEESRNALAEAVARETARIGLENARLAAILHDVPAGVILCTTEHRIVLYNAQAVSLLSGAGEIGLDRPLFGLLREGPIRHAHDRLAYAADADDAADLLCASTDGTRVLHGRMRLVRDAGGRLPPSYVLTLSDATADIAARAGRERLLLEMVESVRRPAANLQTTLDALADPGLTEPQRAHLQAAITTETAALVERIAAFGRRQEATASGWWPKADVAAEDMADALQAALGPAGIELSARCAPLRLRCDGYAIVQLLAGAARELADPDRPLRLTIVVDGEGAMIDLEWCGPPPTVERLDRWLSEPLSGSYAALTRREALEGHGTDLWPEVANGAARLRLPIREARAETDRARPLPRAEFYDFDLLSTSSADLADQRPLDSLGYVVFDTETTGLAPEMGDEIVQIAAVRIVNNRILTGETLDMLVDPERRIPPGASHVHGISDAMVAGAPTIAEAGRRLHAFCKDCVLVAHNAPFDMAFLRRHEERIGAAFTGPVLDTVLLSAILYGRSAGHSLDALAHRLGVQIAAADRHTALGDAKATAQVLLRMLPMLREAGIPTLGQALRASRDHSRLLRAYGRTAGLDTGQTASIS